jgi:hypothetical protein
LKLGFLKLGFLKRRLLKRDPIAAHRIVLVTF